jgi:hypothetical protein
MGWLRSTRTSESKSSRLIRLSVFSTRADRSRGPPWSGSLGSPVTTSE